MNERTVRTGRQMLTMLREQVAAFNEIHERFGVRIDEPTLWTQPTHGGVWGLDPASHPDAFTAPESPGSATLTVPVGRLSQKRCDAPYNIAPPHPPHVWTTVLGSHWCDNNVTPTDQNTP